MAHVVRRGRNQVAVISRAVFACDVAIKGIRLMLYRGVFSNRHARPMDILCRDAVNLNLNLVPTWLWARSVFATDDARTMTSCRF